MSVPLVPSDPEQPRTRHRLQLPRGTAPADVLTMVRNLRPGASEGEDGTLDLGDGVLLIPDPTPRGDGRWTLDVPRDREDPLPEGMGDPHGYGRAFPEGIPFGLERTALDLAWSLARRLHGAIVTDSGVGLEPHPFQVRDLIVVSPHAVDPESLAQLLAPVEPEAELDEVPGGAETSGYSVSVPLAAAEEVSLRVGPSSRPTALAALGWLESATDYELVHLTADPEEDAIEQPDAATAERWARAYRRIGLLAGLLVENVGGYIVDREGLLVAPADLL